MALVQTRRRGLKDQREKGDFWTSPHFPNGCSCAIAIKEQHLRLYVQSLQNAPSGGSLCFLPFLYKDIYIRIYISYKRRVSVCTSSESFCIEKCYPSFTKRKKIKVPKLFSVVFQHLCRQQRALAPLFCAKANPLPLESISLFFKKEKKNSPGFANPPLHTKPQGLNVFSWDLTCAKQIRGVGEDADSLRTPKEEPK